LAASLFTRAAREDIDSGDDGRGIRTAEEGRRATTLSLDVKPKCTNWSKGRKRYGEEKNSRKDAWKIGEERAKKIETSRPRKKATGKGRTRKENLSG